MRLHNKSDAIGGIACVVENPINYAKSIIRILTNLDKTVPNLRYYASNLMDFYIPLSINDLSVFPQKYPNEQLRGHGISPLVVYLKTASGDQ